MKRLPVKISEHDTQKAIIRLLRLAGCLIIGSDVMDGLKFFTDADRRRYMFINHHKDMGYTKGQPDFIFVYRNRVFFAEMKTATGRQSPEQKEFQRQLEAAGQTYLVWRSVQDCVDFITKQRV